MNKLPVQPFASEYGARCAIKAFNLQHILSDGQTPESPSPEPWTYGEIFLVIVVVALILKKVRLR